MANRAPPNSQKSACSEVTEEAWRLKERESQLDEPPMFWLRGNRVYDFHGDRGTVADFEADLLTREVEDDATCRSRRQSLGGDGAVTILVTTCYNMLQQRKNRHNAR